MVQCGLCREAETDAYTFFGNTRKRQREDESPPTEKEWAWRRWLMQHDPTLTWYCTRCVQHDAAEGHLYRRVNLSNDQMMALAIDFAGGEESLDKLTTLLFASWRFLTCAHCSTLAFLHQVCATSASAQPTIFVLTDDKIALTPDGRSLLFPPLPENANVTRYHAETDSFQPAQRRLKLEEKPARALPSAVTKKARGKEVVDSDVPYRKAPTSRKKANEEAKRISEGLENGTLINVFPALVNGITEEYNGAVRMSQVITHTPNQMKITEEGTVVTNQKVSPLSLQSEHVTDLYCATGLPLGQVHPWLLRGQLPLFPHLSQREPTGSQCARRRRSNLGRPPIAARLGRVWRLLARAGD